MATSLTLQNDASLAQGYIQVNGTTSATFTTSGITGNLTGNVTGNVTGNADTATKFSTTTGSAPAYACRAWVNFDGTRDTTGVVSTANTNRLIRSSGNVTSVLRTALGMYTITFAIAMSDANYSVVGLSSVGSNGTRITYLTIDISPAPTINQFGVSNYPSGDGAGGKDDTNIINIQVFGN